MEEGPAECGGEAGAHFRVTWELAKTQISGPHPRPLIQEAWGKARELAFLTGVQVTLMMLI